MTLYPRFMFALTLSVALGILPAASQTISQFVYHPIVGMKPTSDVTFSRSGGTVNVKNMSVDGSELKFEQEDAQYIVSVIDAAEGWARWSAGVPALGDFSKSLAPLLPANIGGDPLPIYGRQLKIDGTSSPKTTVNTQYVKHNGKSYFMISLGLLFNSVFEQKDWSALRAAFGGR